MLADEIRTRYRAGESLRALAAAYGHHVYTIKALLEGMGEPLRSRSEVNTQNAKARSARRRDDPARCRRCEILLVYYPGNGVFCSECLEEISHVS